MFSLPRVTAWPGVHVEIDGRANKPAIIPIITFDPGQSPSYDSCPSSCKRNPDFCLNWTILQRRLPSLSWPRTREDALIFRWGRNLSTVLCWIQIDFIWSSCWLLFIFILLFRFLLYWSCQRSTEWFHVRCQILFVGLKAAVTELMEEQIDAGVVTGGSGEIWSLSPPSFQQTCILIPCCSTHRLTDRLTSQPSVGASLSIVCWGFAAWYSIDPLTLGAYRWLPPSQLLVLRNTPSRCCCVSFPWQIHEIGFISRLRVWLTPLLCFP